MSVLDRNSIDGMAYDEQEKRLCLLLTDYLDWKDERRHLLALQDKINSYVAYIESKQYEKKYSAREIRGVLLEIHFKHDITQNAEKFLQVVQDTVGQLGILLECHIESSQP